MDERALAHPALYVSVLASHLSLDQGPGRSVRATKEQAEYRRAVLEACEQTMERLARDPQYFAKPERSLFQDIRRYFPITAQAQVAWAVNEGVCAAVAFIEEQIEAGAFDGGVPRCHATTRKGKPCQRTPLPERDYCPSHQHLERSRVAA